jgi:Bacterial lectin
VTLPANALIGFTAGSGYYTDNHIITNTTITAGGSGGGGTPTPATLKVTNTISAPVGSTQASATSVFTGTCPTAFTTPALGNGGQSSPSVTAVAGSACTITTPALGTGWSTTVSINGGTPTTLVPSGNTVTVPAFAMVAGANTVAFTSTYTPSGGGTTLPGVGSAGWSLNGSAVTTTGGVLLTPAATGYVAGSTFYSTPVSTGNFSATFDAQLSGGGTLGADGLTLTFADPASATVNSLGAIGGGLGFAGTTGIAVALDTYQNAVNPSGNFVGITNGPIAGSTDQLNWLATNATAQVPNLRTGTIHVTVTAIAGVLTVSINGTQVLSKTVTLPANALIGFTAGSGYYTDNHIITNTTITAN